MKRIAEAIREFAKNNWLEQILPYSRLLIYICALLRAGDLIINLEVIGALASIVFYIALVACIANELWMDGGVALSIVAIAYAGKAVYCLIRVIISGWPIISIVELIFMALVNFYFAYQFLKLAKVYSSSSNNK